MATILLVVIYLAFIGLGVPDSLLGPAWPEMHLDVGAGISEAGYISFSIMTFTFISTVLSTRVINRFGVGKVTAISTMLTVIGLLGFGFTKNTLILYLLTIPLGLGAGTVDSGLNNYVALYYNARQVNMLHCFYGVGVTLSPYIISYAIENFTWRMGYKTAGVLQFAIAIITFIAIPLWKKVEAKQTEVNTFEEKTMPITAIFKNKKLFTMCIMFFAACAIECTAGIWGSTFLVKTRGFSAEDAAFLVMLYYGGMAIGRFLSGVFANKLTSWQLINIGEGLVGLGILMLILPLDKLLLSIGLFLIGMGIGPIYPNMVNVTPENFGKEYSQSAMGLQIAMAYLGIMFMPSLFGVFAKNSYTNVFPLFLAVLFVLLIAFTIIMRTKFKKRKTV